MNVASRPALTWRSTGGRSIRVWRRTSRTPLSLVLLRGFCAWQRYVPASDSSTCCTRERQLCQYRTVLAAIRVRVRQLTCCTRERQLCTVLAAIRARVQQHARAGHEKDSFVSTVPSWQRYVSASDSSTCCTRERQFCQYRPGSDTCPRPTACTCRTRERQLCQYRTVLAAIRVRVRQLHVMHTGKIALYR